MSTSSTLVRTALALSLGLASMIATSACSSTKTTEGQAPIEQNKVTGNSSTIVTANLDKAYAGAIRAVNDLQFKLEKQAKDSLKGVLTARTADNKSVSITLSRRSDTVTEIEVSAGPIEQSLSRTVLEKIQAELK